MHFFFGSSYCNLLAEGPRHRNVIHFISLFTYLFRLRLHCHCYDSITMLKYHPLKALPCSYFRCYIRGMFQIQRHLTDYRLCRGIGSLTVGSVQGENRGSSEMCGRCRQAGFYHFRYIG